LLTGTNLVAVRRDGVFAVNRKPAAPSFPHENGNRTNDATPPTPSRRATDPSPGNPTRGTVTGRVSNQATGAFLEGAR
jgi:hypothetical protein